MVDLDVVRRGKSEHTNGLVTALAPVELPIAEAGRDRVVVIGKSAYLDGEESLDPSGRPLTYDWRVVGAPLGSAADVDEPAAPTTSITPDVLGTYVLELVVHNGAAASAPSSITLEAVAEDPIVPGDVAIGAFVAGEVYLLGTVVPALCGSEAVAHWSDPFTATAGFGCSLYDGLLLHDGTLAYWSTSVGSVREFRCDGCPAWQQGDPYPSDPLTNDVTLAYPRCDDDNDGALAVLAGVDGGMLASCITGWYDESGTKVLPDLRPLVAYGHERVALGADGTLIDFASHVERPVTGLPAGAMRAARVQPQGFWVAVDRAELTELWLIDQDSASASLVTTYAPLPPGYVDLFAGDSALDARGSLFQIATVPSVAFDLIIRRRIDGVSDVVYTEDADPIPWVQIHASRLVTGP